MRNTNDSRFCPPSRRWLAIWRVLAVFLLLFSLFCPSALALPPQSFIVENILLSTEEETLMVNLGFSVDDEDGLRDMLKDGAVLELKITLSLERERSWWSNKTIEKKETVFHLRHDPLTREFVFLPQNGTPSTPVRDKNLTRLINATIRQLHLPLVSLAALVKEGMEQDYAVKANIGLRYTDVPPWLEKSAVFWSTVIIPEHTEALPFHY